MPVTRKQSTTTNLASGVIPDFPFAPATLVDLPGFTEYQQDLQGWWNTVQERMSDLQTKEDTRVFSLKKTINTATGELMAAIEEERTVRVSEDQALATDITSVESSLTTAIGVVSSSVSTEATARATADGYLAGSYVLRVAAGNRVAGMAITAIEDPLGWDTTSEISFLADSFKIYNGTTDVAPFQVVSGQVRITGALVLSASDVSDLGALATEDEVDYADLAGTKPPSNADVTLSAVNGGLVVTGGGITLSAGGAIKGGASDFSTGTGFFLGYEDGQYKFRVGDPAGSRIEWNGSSWTVVVPGITPPAIAAAPTFGFDPDPMDSTRASCTIYNNEAGGFVQWATFAGASGSFSGDEYTIPGWIPAWQEVYASVSASGKLSDVASDVYEFGIPP